MTLPNFVIIGAAKAGTTSIAQYLDQHSQIYISPVKEPFFFSFESQEIDFSGPGDDQSLRLAVTTLQDYEQLFDGVTDETAVGEASTSYLYTPKAVERIHHHLPDVKIIAILRNPVDKAYSSFLHQVREGYEPLDSFSQALEDEEIRIQKNWMYFWHYRHNGFYYQKLKRYYDHFPSEQIHVYLFEDFNKNPLQFMQNLFNVLEVDSSFEPDFSIRYNISGVPRSRLLHVLMTKSRFVKKFLKPIVPRPFRQKVRRFNLEKPTLPAQVRQDLMNGYRQDILSLQDLIQRDLSGWLA